jgi:hypothetical protein
MTRKSLLFRTVTASTLACLTLPAARSAAADASLLQKPSWLTDLSLGVKESYDDNIFAIGNNSLAAYTVPAGSIAALPNRSSWETTVSPKVGVNFAKLLGDQNTFEALSLSYAPDFVAYHSEPWENYDAQRFTAAVKGKADHLSFNLEDTVTYLDGSDYGSTYLFNADGQPILNAWSAVAALSRVKQLQNAGKFSVQYDGDNFFIRPMAYVAMQDPKTKLLNPAVTGVALYEDYPERYDANGGVDLGYKAATNLALTLGYRYGHQYQQQMPWASGVDTSSSCDYQRVLLGVEGKPVKWLTVSAQGGPDFRSYVDTAAVNDFHPVKYYGEASIAAQPTANDTFSLKYRQMEWLSLLGVKPYFDSRYELNYHRNLWGANTWSLDLGGRVWDADYKGASVDNLRDDMLITPSAKVTWAPTEHLSLNLGYLANLGRNLQKGVTDPETRCYNQNVVSLGAQYKF